MALKNLAQSFRVQNRPGGVFVTKVDLYFSKKDALLPVTVSIREMKLGVPTKRVVPFSSITKFPSDTAASNDDFVRVQTSTDGSKASTFHFKSPVYLKNDTDYALVVTPGGNSKNYSVWTAKLGDFDKGTTNIISEQPLVGTLFLSADGTTFTESQDIDLRFTMYCANFESTGTLVQENEKFDDLTIAPISGGTFKTGELVFGNTTSGHAFANTKGSGVVKSYVANTVTKLVLGNRLNSAYTVGMKVNGQESNAVGTITAINDYLVDTVHYNFGIINLGDTDLSSSLKATSNNNVQDSSFGTKIELNRDIDMINVKKVMSYSNEIANLSGKKSSLLQTTMTTRNANISPAIDVEKSTAYLINNLINNTSTNETNASGGDAEARYITRRVTLADNQNAEDLLVYLTAYKPSETTINVYYKILNSADSEDFDDKSYVEMTQVTNTGTNSVTNNLSDFIEYKYQIPSANMTGISNAVAYTSGLGATFSGFNVFAIKIVMLSTTDVVVPQIRDLRAIALQV